jgi:hypothetical protein
MTYKYLPGAGRPDGGAATDISQLQSDTSATLYTYIPVYTCI